MPDFVVVGAAKAGTSTLRAALRRHPGVFLPDVDEPGWFAWQDGAPRLWPSDVPADVPIRSAEDYAALWSDAPVDALRGEVCPLYLESPVAPGKLRAAHPDVRVVVTLRDPVDRAWSSYWMHARGGLETRPPEDAFDPDEHRIQIGRYARNLDPWLERFPREQIQVLFFEEWTADGLHALAAFLGLASLPLPPPANVGGRPRNRLVGAALASPTLRSVGQRLPDALKGPLRDRALTATPPMPAELRAQLESLYADEADALEQQLGMRPPWAHRDYSAP